MANPHTDPMKYLKPALIIGGSLLGWNYVIAPTLEALGIKPDASDKIMDKVENYDINRDYWSANYYSQIPSGNEAIILTSAKANELAAQIKKAKSIFNDDESAIYAAFRQLKYKTQVSFLVYWFNRLYKEDLYSWLKDEVLNDEEMRVVLTITEKLPLGIRNVSTGKITGVGTAPQISSVYYRVNPDHPNAVRLQSVGCVLGTPASNIKVGDTLMWNYGGKEEVQEILKETDKTITISVLYNNKLYERKLLKTRLVCILEKKDINKTDIGAAPQNLVSLLNPKYSNEIKMYGITEVFVKDGEVYTTSNFDLPSYLIQSFETELLRSNSVNTIGYSGEIKIHKAPEVFESNNSIYKSVYLSYKNTIFSFMTVENNNEIKEVVIKKVTNNPFGTLGKFYKNWDMAQMAYKDPNTKNMILIAENILSNTTASF